MSLFKAFKGNRAALDTVEKHSGYVYFCVDDGSLFFDYADADGNLYRKQINAYEAEKITGYDIAAILNSSDVEIPTSKAVLEAVEAAKADATNNAVIVLAEAQKYVDKAIANIEIPDGFSGSYNDLTDVPTEFNPSEHSHDDVLSLSGGTVTGQVKVQSGDPNGALVIGADVSAHTITAGKRKLARVVMPTQENSSLPLTILSADTMGDGSSTIGGSGQGHNRIEFGGRSGANTTTSPDSMAFTIAKSHNATGITEKVYALEMNAEQARFNVQPKYNDKNLLTENDLPPTSADNAGKVLTTNESGLPEWQEPTGGEIDTSDLVTVDKIAEIDTWWAGTYDVEDAGDGISWKDGFALLDANGDIISEGLVTQKFPLVAGDNIQFDVDPHGGFVTINATGGSSTDDSMVGTWVFNDEITKPEPLPDAYTFPLSYSCVTPRGETVVLNQFNFYDDGEGGWVINYYFEDDSNPIYYEEVYINGEGWGNEVFKTINLLKEPSAEVAAWIRANAKRYEPIGVEQISLIDTFDGDMEEVSDDGDGIIWSNYFSFERNGNELARGVIAQKIPITAGKNVTFSYDEENNAIAINATGGDSSTDDSLVGTWVLNDTLTNIPNANYSLSFICDGIQCSTFSIAPLGPPVNRLSYIGDSRTFYAYYFPADEMYGQTAGWIDDTCKTINIIEEPTDDILISWIRANATKQAIEYQPKVDHRLQTNDKTVVGAINELAIKVTHNNSIGLIYELSESEDEAYYTITGIGTCTDTDIIIPSTYEGLPVTKIGEYAFSGCYSLTSIIIPDSITSIGRSAFSACSSLTSLVIPDGVTTIGENAFRDCSFSSVVIGEGVTTIGSYAFYDCTNLKNIYYKSTKENWNNITIDTNNDSLTNATIHYNYADDFMSVNDRLGDVSSALELLIAQTNALIGGTK